MSTALPPTLGQRLLRHVLVPLAVTWVAGTFGSVAVAQLFAERAFDRVLLDDAYLLATHVRREGRKGLRLDLTADEVKSALFDQEETVSFSVRTADGRLVAGRDDLLMEPEEGDGSYRLEPLRFDRKTVRAITMHRDKPLPFDVTVAQTTSARNALLRELLVYALPPQVLLLALLAWWLRRTIRRDAEPLAVLERAVQHRGADDLAPVPVEASTRDVQALAGAINALLERLERSVRAQREFSGNVAHELRTPLAGIRALADYGLAHKDPAVWHEQLAAIAASEARASALVDRLLAVALAAEAESRLTLQPVALDAVVREMVLRYLHRADAAGVDLGARGIDAPAWIAGDKTLLEGILGNLLDNALRYGVDPAAAAPAVTVAIERQGDELVLSVHDNGPGAPGEDQVALVERGAQGEAGQLLGEGVGLGLALVAQYARLLRGRMQLHSGPGGRGWICEIAFPALPAPA